MLSLLRNSYAEVPSIWLSEVRNVLLINERRARIISRGSQAFLTTLANLDIRVDPSGPTTDDESLLALARRHGLTAYDAAYLELAQRRGLPLATFDKDLLRAAPLAGVALLSAP